MDVSYADLRNSADSIGKKLDLRMSQVEEVKRLLQLMAKQGMSLWQSEENLIRFYEITR